jgi:NADPH2:quinone reductase
VQAARSVGATVVGVAGGARKIAEIERLGADVAVDYRAGDAWPEQVRAALDGRPVTLALDGVGGDTGRAALGLVAPGGRMVIYGYASGEPMPLSVADLFGSGVTVIPGIGVRLLERPGGIRALAAAALGELAAGNLVPLVHPPFPLAEAADAHRALESRATIGKVVLAP